MEAETPQVVIDQPQYAVVVNKDTAGKHWLGLFIQSSSVQMTVFLGYAQNGDVIADEFFQRIREAGIQGRRDDSGLLAGKAGDIHAIDARAKGRQQRGKGKAG